MSHSEREGRPPARVAEPLNGWYAILEKACINGSFSSYRARRWRAPRGFGLDADKVAEITGEIVDVHALGVEIGVVVGGGNFFRGVEEQAREMDRVSADNMGMLSTVINAIAMQDALEQRGVHAG